MKPIEFLGGIFFDLMRIQPKETFYSTSLFLAKSIVTLDMKDKKKKGQDISINLKHLKELEYIMRNTDKEILKPIATIEAVVASKDRERWGDEYGGKNNQGEYIDIDDHRASILDLYQKLKESYDPVIMAVVDIVQEYSADYRMSGGNDMPSWLNQEV